MNLKSLLTAVAVSAAMAVPASAAVEDIVDAGGDSTPFPYVGTLTLDFDAADTAAFDDTSARFNFSGTAGSTDTVDVNVLNSTVLSFGNLVTQFEYTTALVHVDGTTIDLLGGQANLFIPVTVSNPITLTFDLVGTGTFDFQLRATPVPVPAGILLMGTALAGFGVMRRRKKAA